MTELKKIILLDIYGKLYEELQILSKKHKLNFEELHELYLKDLHIQITTLT